MRPLAKTMVLGFFSVSILGCAHSRVPKLVEAPNWFWWGRNAVGARPIYPDQAWQDGLEGDTVSEVCLDDRGNVMSLKAVSGPALLSSAALRALATWQFDPIDQGGHATSGCFVRRFYFRKAPTAADFYRTEGEMTVTRGYEPPLPEYRPMVRAAGARGSVYVRVCTHADGTQGDATVMQGISREVDRAVAAEVNAWRFSPAKLAGTPIAACQVERIVLNSMPDRPAPRTP